METHTVKGNVLMGEKQADPQAINDLAHIADFARTLARSDPETIKRGIARHWWTTKCPDDIQKCIKRLKVHNEVLDAIQKRWPNKHIYSIEDGDEVYYAVSPKGAQGGDRALVDCHYDAPFGWIPNAGVTYVRVIISCTRHGSVKTVIKGKPVVMSFGDFHGIDYNNDFHCAEGKISSNEDRVLLKLHYIVANPDLDSSSLPFKMSKNLNVGWTYISRELMRASAAPRNFGEYCLGRCVMAGRWIYNHWLLTLLFLTILAALIYVICSVNYSPDATRQYFHVSQTPAQKL